MWYRTSNLHFLSILDFREFCLQIGVTVIRQDCFNPRGEVVILPNVFAAEVVTLVWGLPENRAQAPARNAPSMDGKAGSPRPRPAPASRRTAPGPWTKSGTANGEVEWIQNERFENGLFFKEFITKFIPSSRSVFLKHDVASTSKKAKKKAKRPHMMDG